MSDPDPRDPTPGPTPTPREVDGPTANPGRLRSFHRPEILARFPIHAVPTCLSGTTAEGWVLLGFSDSKVGAWHPSTGAYLLRPFRDRASAKVLGLAWSSFPTAGAVFDDTSVLAWDVLSGQIHGYHNHDQEEKRAHNAAVDAAWARCDPETGEPSDLYDAALLEGSATSYSMNPSLLGRPDGFVYCLIEPGIDSSGTPVIDIPRLARWDGSPNDPDWLGTPTDDCRDVSLRPGPGNTILVLIDDKLIQVDLTDGRETPMDWDQWSYGRLIEASLGPPGRDVVRVVAGLGLRCLRSPAG